MSYNKFSDNEAFVLFGTIVVYILLIIFVPSIALLLINGIFGLTLNTAVFGTNWFYMLILLGILKVEL